METRFYTFEDWSIARWIISSNLPHRRCDLVWAQQVIGYFKEYMKTAKLYMRHFTKGSWHLAVKCLWENIRRFSHPNEIHGLKLGAILAVQRENAQRRAKGRGVYPRRRANELSGKSVIGAKGKLANRAKKLADALQSLETVRA